MSWTSVNLVVNSSKARDGMSSCQLLKGRETKLDSFLPGRELDLTLISKPVWQNLLLDGKTQQLCLNRAAGKKPTRQQHENIVVSGMLIGRCILALTLPPKTPYGLATSQSAEAPPLPTQLVD